MKKVYIVTSGDYSDYHIEAVFSRRDKALDFKNEEKSDNDIEEFELDRPISDFRYISITMKKNGDTVKIHPFMNSYNNEGFFQYNINSELIWVVKTNNEKRAIKVTNEKRTQILAAECWNDFLKTLQLFFKNRND